MFLVQLQLLVVVQRTRQQLQLLYGGDEGGHQVILAVVGTELERRITTGKY